MFLRTIKAASLALLVSISSLAKAQVERNPANPLIAFDPYFSVWSMADNLTDQETKHWTGTDMPMHGLARIDGVTYRWMGREPRSAPAMQQSALHLTPTQTEYTFQVAGVRLQATFLSPSIPNDLDLLAQPVTYLTWNVSATDGKPHSVQLYLGVDARIAVNSADQQVTWRRSTAGSLQVLSVGSTDQRVLVRAGDNLRADRGYFHLVVPAGPQVTTSTSVESPAEFLKAGTVTQDDDLDQPREAGRAPLLAVAESLQVGADQTVERHVGLAFTQPFVVEYLDRRLRPYWLATARPCRPCCLTRCRATPRQSSSRTPSTSSSRRSFYRMAAPSTPGLERSPFARPWLQTASLPISTVRRCNSPRRTSRTAASLPSTCSILRRLSSSTSTRRCWRRS